ncbi:CheR family methyltransferase [Methanoplanus endosymbiosus]|uniref:Methyltransferase domain-containing protein n=1 Tax=Methanoplanus endosymbiosus TaxID=33865 RepID=A0A9E7TM06_9EURY|nr:CheR family methyltransferase [Methanoplanus endosymbiosus]UUX92881.1 methyltransferase domain-containing protein [Methanoplanus endosymbiosus]
MGATYFFRDLHTLNMVHSVIIPEIIRYKKSVGDPEDKTKYHGTLKEKTESTGTYNKNNHPEFTDINAGTGINIWSAGCANGSEPYTLAIILKEALDDLRFSEINIYATDIDPNNRFKAIIDRGSYPEEALAKIPAGMFNRYFDKDPEKNGNHIISDNIRNHVKYIHHDLLSLRPVAEKPFDVILCKNVLLHFSEEQRINVINMFYNSLTDGGFFITEQTQKMPEQLSVKFEQIVSNARIYRKIRY